MDYDFTGGRRKSKKKVKKEPTKKRKPKLTLIEPHKIYPRGKPFVDDRPTDFPKMSYPFQYYHPGTFTPFFRDTSVIPTDPLGKPRPVAPTLVPPVGMAVHTTSVVSVPQSSGIKDKSGTHIIVQAKTTGRWIEHKKTYLSTHPTSTWIPWTFDNYTNYVQVPPTTPPPPPPTTAITGAPAAAGPSSAGPPPAPPPALSTATTTALASLASPPSPTTASSSTATAPTFAYGAASQAEEDYIDAFILDTLTSRGMTEFNSQGERDQAIEDAKDAYALTQVGSGLKKKKKKGGALMGGANSESVVGPSVYDPRDNIPKDHRKYSDPYITYQQNSVPYTRDVRGLKVPVKSNFEYTRYDEAVLLGDSIKNQSQRVKRDKAHGKSVIPIPTEYVPFNVHV